MATAFDDAETAIITLWQAGWTAAPVEYENALFDPANPGGSFIPGEAWVEFKITELPGLGQISTVNETTRRWRVPGLVGVNANVPVGRGKQILRQLLDEAANIFRAYNGVTSGGGTLLFFNPQMTAAGPSTKDPAWFQASMLIRFWYDYNA